MTRRSFTSWLSALGVLALASLAAAQSGPLIGYTTSLAPADSDLTRQVLCSRPTTLCARALPPRPESWAGGATYDPIHRAMWHTDGVRLQRVPLASCVPDCELDAKRVLGDKSLVGGLTMDRPLTQLLHVESVPGTMAVVTYYLNTKGCPEERYTWCSLPLPTAQHRSGAIARDRKRDLILVATSVFDDPAPLNRLQIIRRQGIGCQLLCSLTMPPCSNGPLQAVRAMAFDECKDLLYVSDGRQTTVMPIVWGASQCPSIGIAQCCPLGHPTGQLWSGFDLQPAPPTSVGKSCTGAPCPVCPQMRLETSSDAVLGNLAFGLSIADGPAGGIGVVVVNVAPCNSGIPLFCGQLHAFPPTFILPPFALAGLAPCGGLGTAPLPLPNNFALCGLQICAQGVVLCPGKVIGAGVTNALAIVLDSD